MKKGKLIILALIAVLAMIFVAQNSPATNIHFLFWHLEISLSLALAFVFLSGAAVGWIGSLFFVTRNH